MPNSIVAELLVEPYRFSFFQAVSLLQAAHADQPPIGGFTAPTQEVVRLRGAASLAFPAAQLDVIKQASPESRPQYQVTTTLPSLTGVLSPLPLYYTSDLIASGDPDFDVPQMRLRDFIDIFNHRLLSLLYRTDEYRACLNPNGRGNAHYRTSLMRFLGHAQDVDDPGGFAATVTMATGRLLAMQPRSSAGLLLWLHGYFPATPLGVQECVPHRVRIPDESLMRLGQRNSTLGASDTGGATEAIVGDWTIDQETRFRVVVGPLPWSEYLLFLPKGESLERLVSTVKSFIPDFLTFDVSLMLLGADCRHLKVVLDGETSELGLTTGLFSDSGADHDLVLVLEFDFSRAETDAHQGGL